MDRRKTIGFRYLLTEQIGEGAVAVVWKAFDIVEDRDVAIKLLKDVFDPEDAARLQMEVAIVSRLRHPNIIRFLDQGTTERGRRYVVMELLEGESLRDRLLRTSPLDPEEGLIILVQILDALAAAHAAKIVHRDIKPENIYLVSKAAQKPGIKLLDFGMAKVLGGDSTLTWSGVLFGTPHYMAPERIRGEESRPPADVYATAVMAYEIFCGKRPFEGKSPEDVMKAHLLDPSPRPCKAIPEPSRRPLLSAMDKTPENRPDALQLLDTVRRILGDAPRGESTASIRKHDPPVATDSRLARTPSPPNDRHRHPSRPPEAVQDPTEELEGIEDIDQLQDLEELDNAHIGDGPAPAPTSDLDIE